MSIQYLDIIQTDPEVFNKNQKLKQQKFLNENSKEKLNYILYSRNHNELKSSKTLDYRLDKNQLEQLEKNGLTMKHNIKNEYGRKVSSFGDHLSYLYSNDIPVMITSDMMLFALHRFYDETLEIIEKNLIPEFKDLCESLLNTIHEITVDSKIDNLTEYLKGLEMYLLVPYFILHSQIKNMNPHKIRSYEYDEYEWHHMNDPKIYEIGKTTILPKLNTIDEVNKIVEKIMKFESFDIKLNNTVFSLDGTTFKPRGHYDKTTELSNYFMAFTWFSKMIVKLNKSEKNSYKNNIIFAIMLAKIGEKSLEKIIKIEKFIKTIIGESDGYTFTSFINDINSQIEIIPNQNLTEFFHWITSTNKKNEIIELMKLKKKCKLTKIGDMLHFDNTEFCFSLIGKGTTYDNIVINGMVDNEFKKNTELERKYPSIFDITYAMFGNTDSLDFAKKRMKKDNENVKTKVNRDGVEYTKYLTKVKTEMDNENITGNTLYNQELLMLRALSKPVQISPFNTKAWGYKQTQTQIGHYSEIRHDNVLYLEECEGCCLMCEHPDILIEPCLEFWQEYLNLIDIMNELVTTYVVSKKEYDVNWLCNEKIKNFKNIVNKFITYLKYFLKNEQVPEDLKKELKCILEISSGGSGPPSYSGWWASLFYNMEHSTMNKHEVSSYFTGVPDDRDKGGICHLGNGDVQLLYIVVNNKVFVGPVYEMYEVITPYNNRYNDSEWEKNYNNHTPLDFNLQKSQYN